ncbi:hypothetical protein [Halalkalibacter oceani]|uniref:hypothetical protein n=1 Tax=Halalkalibacter oceani TaxID=1653776 RepID=UPI00339686C5
MTTFTLTLTTKADIVNARNKIRQAAEEIGFSPIDRTKVVTAISELTRTVIRHAAGATMMVQLLDELEKTGMRITVTISDSPAHIPEKPSVLRTILDEELHHVKRLMNTYAITAEPEKGITISTGKWALK